MKEDRSSDLSGFCSHVQQGSVLGLLLFAAYVSPVVSITESFGVWYQQYTDDTVVFVCTRFRHTASVFDCKRTRYCY